MFLLCSLYGLYVGSNGSSNSNNGLFNFNVNNTPDGNSNAARLIQSEVLRREIPLPKNNLAAIYRKYDIGFGIAFLTLRGNLGDEDRG